MELELPRRDVPDDDTCAEPSELECEATRPRSCIEYAIALVDVLAEESEMDFEADAIHRCRIEALPFAHAVLIEETRDVLRVVRNASHAPTSAAPRRAATRPGSP